MNRFLKKCFLFFSIVAVGMYSFDRILSGILKMDQNYAQGEVKVWNDIINENIKSDIYVYGSSRAWRHFDPQIIEDLTGMTAYNFGIDGHNFNLQLLRHELLMKHNPKPSVILLSLDIFTLEKRQDLFNFEQLLPFLMDDQLFYEYTADYVGFDTEDYFVPAIRYFGNAFAIKEAIKKLMGDDIMYRFKGFKSNDREWSTEFEDAREERKAYTIKFDPETVTKFENFIRECKEQNIELIFVYSPEFAGAESFVLNRSDFFTRIERLSEQWSIPYFNYFEHPITHNREYFYNSQHLNSRGAEVFSRTFGADLLDDPSTCRIFKRCNE